ncbi:MAG: 50S ribosomal protein L11 methyltransferase [Flavobacteriales bacterium]|nr:50S ribosomal protein L11 methyltransferase [Flavobacteriales bacterium]
MANIERNTLVRSMVDMAAALAANGKLLLSGFVREDGEVMAKSAMDAGLRHVLTLEEGEWAFSEWEK